MSENQRFFWGKLRPPIPVVWTRFGINHLETIPKLCILRRNKYLKKILNTTKIMWKTTPTELFERRITRFLKKHAREAKAALDNLDMYFSLLQKGTKPGAIKVGFTHNEPSGVKAIDQKGGGKALAQTRLYVFPEEEVETLHLITIGDKNSQKADIADCRDFMKSLQQTKI